MRVFINGFGRIGRSVLRAWALDIVGRVPRHWADVQIVGINDIAAAEMCAYLFEFDSVFGPWGGSVALHEGALVVNGTAIPLTQAPDLSALDLSGVDLVMECTGRADTRTVAMRGIEGGARRVLVSGPSAAAQYTVVLGANEAGLDAALRTGQKFCRTPLVRPML